MQRIARCIVASIAALSLVAAGAAFAAPKCPKGELKLAKKEFVNAKKTAAKNYNALAKQQKKSERYFKKLEKLKFKKKSVKTAFEVTLGKVKAKWDKILAKLEALRAKYLNKLAQMLFQCQGYDLDDFFDPKLQKCEQLILALEKQIVKVESKIKAAEEKGEAQEEATETKFEAKIAEADKKVNHQEKLVAEEEAKILPLEGVYIAAQMAADEKYAVYLEKQEELIACQSGGSSDPGAEGDGEETSP